MKKKRVFCVSGGGASAGAYLIWFKDLPKDFSLELLELPGRGLRKSEPCHETMDQIVADFYATIRRKITSPDDEYYLVGYCFGVGVVYNLYKQIKADGFVLPKRLFFAGGGPTDYRPRNNIFEDENNERGIGEVAQRYFPETLFRDRRETARIARRFSHLLFEKQARYGRLVPVTMEELFPAIDESDPLYEEKRRTLDFANETQRILDLDLRLGTAECNKPGEYEHVGIDVTVFIGEGDRLAPMEEAQRWRQYVDADFEIVPVAGAHAFIFEEPGCHECVRCVVDRARAYEGTC